MREQDLQRQILDWLRIKRIFCWRNNSGAFTGAHNGKQRFVRFGAVGSPDIFALLAGKLYGIEVKGPKGKLSDAQRSFQERFEDEGGIYVIAHCLEDVSVSLFPIGEP